MARKAVTKKTRFEVFKRDSFTCQYCGKSAPDVVLHLDHIEPVAKGGGNDILNLITSCFDCNMGKSDRALSDNAVLTKQVDQLKEMNERREQIKMMAKWRAGMVSVAEASVQAVEDEINKFIAPSKHFVSPSYRTELAKMVRKYSLPEIFEAIDKADHQYLKDPSNIECVRAFTKYIPRICYWQKIQRESPEEDGIRHIIAIIAKRNPSFSRPTLYRDLKTYASLGADIDDMKQTAYQARSAYNFCDMMKSELGLN